MFAKAKTNRLFAKSDASHTPGKNYKTTVELMRGPSAEMVAWRETRADLAKQLREATNPAEKSRIRGELLGEIAFGRPAQEYAQIIDPLPATSFSEVAVTSAGKPRSLANQRIMRDYLRFRGRMVEPENSSRR